MDVSRRTCLTGLATLAVPVAVDHAKPGRASSTVLPMSGRLRHLAYSDQGGRPDGVQVMVNGKTLYVGHMFSNGLTVMNIEDPAKPTPVKFIAAPPNTRTHHLQTNGDLMLVVCGADIPTIGKYNPGVSYYQQSFGGNMTGKLDFAAGLKIYDISKPADPREIAFLNIPGIGLNRLWYAGGRYAYIAAHMDGFTDHILAIVDIAEPTKPEIIGRWWMPGMWAAGGETPTWSNRRVALHHMIVAGDLGYAAWRDGGFTILDISDKTKPRLVSHRNTMPPYSGGTHTPLPLPKRKLAIILDESSSLGCSKGLSYNWIYDVRNPENPVSIATLPTPSEEDFCRPGQNFGPHNLHENRPGTFQSEDLIFATYHNAGLRVFDIRNAYQPLEVARYVAPPPARILDPRPGNALAPQTCDANVQPDGIIYLSDWNAGMHVLQYEAKTA